MQFTKGTWRMCEQCVPGSLSSYPAQQPENEANQCTHLLCGLDHGYSGLRLRGASVLSCNDLGQLRVGEAVVTQPTEVWGQVERLTCGEEREEGGGWMNDLQGQFSFKRENFD